MRGDEVAGGDGLAYHIVYEGYPDFGPVKVTTLAICKLHSVFDLKHKWQHNNFLGNSGLPYYLKD